MLLSVLMTKMMTDWFAGRELVLAMSVFINSFPIGIALALLSLGWLADNLGWPAAFHATAVLALAALLLVALVYQRHPNDGKTGQTEQPDRRISRQEVMLVCLAGINWGLYNAVLGIMLGFTPILLTTQGMAVAEAGLMISLTTWLMVGSVQAGGIIAQRWGHPNLLLPFGCVLSAACLLLLPSAAPLVTLVLIGAIIGLPAAIIVSLPAEVLRPESRGTGMGLFYTSLYIGFAVLPPIAGWLQDLSGGPAASLYFASALMLSIIPVLVAFRLLQGRVTVPAR